MRHDRTVRVGLTVLLGGAFWATSAGCTHNYYYGSVPGGCPPSAGGSPSVVQYGSVCEVPSQVVDGGTVIATNPPGTLPALGGPRPPRIVLSDSPNSSRLAWRRSDPDGGLATTRVEGARDDSTVTK